MSSNIDIYRSPLAHRQSLGELVVADNAEPDDDRLDFGHLLMTLRRNLRVAIAIMLAVLGATAYITATQPRRYAATSQIVIDLQKNQITPQQDPGGATATLSPSDQVDTEAKVLMSRDIAQRVAATLDLSHNPHFNPALAPPPTGPLHALRQALGLAPPPARYTNERVRRSIVDRLLSGLQITRAGDSYAVDITATAATPEDARDVANQFARQYIGSRVHQESDENKTASTFLADKLDHLRALAHNDTQQVQQYRVAHNLLSTSGASLTEQEISSYNQAVATARAQAAEDEARLNTARAQLRGGSTGDDVGEALGSGVVGTLRARQAEVSGRLAALQARYNDAHPDVQRTRSELDDINRQIQAEIGRVISNLEARARVSNDRLGSLSGSLSSARGTLAENNRAMTDLDDLERRATASQALYDSYLERYKQVSAQSGTEQPNAHLISAAELPLEPTSPNVKLNMVLGTLLAIAAGVIGAFVAEWRFAGLTTAAEVEDRFGVPCLASVPDYTRAGPRGGRKAAAAAAQSPQSLFTEAFRTLKAGLFRRADTVPRVITVTSSLPHEGKTTIATCLARVLARTGQSVVLVDCDRRHARVSCDLVDRRDAGLLEHLEGSATLDDVLVKDQITSLMILPLRENADPREDLLGGSETSQLFEELKKRFNYVVVDTPPVLAIAETRLLAALSDAVLVVVHWRRTADHAVRATLRLLELGGARVTGVILSRVDLARQLRFAHGDATYYYRHYKDYFG